ncbi:[protein-PII] uridylyltransferase family protein [Sulfitobacter guttiformis]|uniref:Glutamate-ammonia-ligase adenylyltransferase n=1 Tax=Sulfitobacter guttiformis TaxID=74349 RepID=A0A420DIG5_9RHOB|nr:glutamine-synthetase adenylyltransferase [Sulfitobacter guttiformis]KIN72226.1 Glutamate-ammonia-ligase adenylyltransferase [Sulfitobacter guttiformis KCTC 32187]RKE94004.1 glutamate-ammonia-ligase adenylyltransferase [Sulfitobacter guttiformis]
MVDISLVKRLSRCPRCSDAVENDVPLARFDTALHPLLSATAGLSPYMATLIGKEAAWLEGAVEAPEKALADLLGATTQLEGDTVAGGLRQGKRRVALLSALADLGGAWSLEEVTGALTQFADAATQAALRVAVGAQIKRGKLPGLEAEDAMTGGGMTVLAMGKMGAGELNYSSDIDLICLFDESRYAPDDFQEARAGLIKATRAMAATLSEITGDGYVFRTDLRLRPDPAVTPVCVGLLAAERYYESLGRTWERAAYIKARPCAGDIEVGEGFLRTLRPFVWRKHLDFAAIQDAHDMRLAIREHKGLGGSITLPGHNMKLGRGGIREIEFFTQTRQLIAGGRDVDLRVRGTKAGLDVLAQKGWVPREAAEVLSDHYTFHRTVEHRLQMVRDAQTHTLPQTPEGMTRIAAMMDMDVAAFEAGLRSRLSAVHEITEGFFTQTRGETAPLPTSHSFDEAITEGWRSYPALRSDRGAELFERLKPELLARLAKADKPDEALLAFDGFLAGLPAGVQLFSLLKSNPQLADLLINIVSVSPMLAAHLSRNAGVLDAVIGGDFWTDWPGQEELLKALSAQLAGLDGYEAQLDGTRAWAREWHFRIGVHHLQGLTDGARSARQYSDLARVVLRALWPVVIAEFSRRHGPPPGRGAVIVGMGSLGAGRLTAQSDLDLIMIYDADGVEASEGKRPLPARQYYARLTQAMITAMSAPMAQGRLYELDLRLRPSGNKGPVATSIDSFTSYQRDEAWVWEHLALTRAEVIAGPDALAQTVEALREEIINGGHDAARVCIQTAQMRARIAAAKSPEGVLDAKIGAGRLQDIELFAQAGALVGRTLARDIPAGLAAARHGGLINEEDEAPLVAAYEQLWALQAATRLLSSRPLHMEALRRASRQFLIHAAGAGHENDTADAIEAQLERLYGQADAIITTSLGPLPDEGLNGDTGDA